MDTVHVLVGILTGGGFATTYALIRYIIGHQTHRKDRKADNEALCKVAERGDPELLRAMGEAMAKSYVARQPAPRWKRFDRWPRRTWFWRGRADGGGAITP